MPGDATSPEKLWELIFGGRTAWSEIPADRWTMSSYQHPHTERKGAVSIASPKRRSSQPDSLTDAGEDESQRRTFPGRGRRSF